MPLDPGSIKEQEIIRMLLKQRHEVRAVDTDDLIDNNRKLTDEHKLTADALQKKFDNIVADNLKFKVHRG